MYHILRLLVKRCKGLEIFVKDVSVIIGVEDREGGIPHGMDALDVVLDISVQLLSLEGTGIGGRKGPGGIVVGSVGGDPVPVSRVRGVENDRFSVGDKMSVPVMSREL